MNLLSINDLVVRFRTHDGTVYAVNGVSFDLDQGETLGLVGESGCGKSVTNLAVMRLLPAPAGKIEGGKVYFDGQDLLSLDESEMRDLRGKDIAMIFQDPMTSLNPVLTIEEQMEIGRASCRERV
jgi:ABC-type dipeptide/oligopeptide/nickel transport system, ATPase component